MQVNFKVTLFTGTLRADLDEDVIHMPSGQTCTYSHFHCLDFRRGYTFWRNDPVLSAEDCQKSDYSVLFAGDAELVTSYDRVRRFNRTVYTVNQKEHAFALEVKDPKLECETAVFRTDHPQLFILDNHKGDFWSKSGITFNAINVDFAAYVNTKFVYVEKHTQTQAMALYRDLLVQKCKVEKTTIQTLLTLAVISPEEFAFAYMNKPGYTAKLAGEVAYIGKCKPVTVEFRSDERCWLELPVTYHNQSMFLTPRNRILVSYGHEIPCNPLLPTKYLFQDGWYMISKHPVRSESPTILSPSTEETWNYSPIGDLLSKGLYSREDIDKYQRMTLTRGETDAISDSIAQGVLGYPVDMRGFDFSKVITESSMDSMLEGFKKRLSDTWYGFGDLMAPFVGVWFVWKIITYLTGCGISGIALHKKYGWSWRLMFCCCEVMSFYCLALGWFIKKYTKEDKTDLELLREIKTDNPMIEERPEAVTPISTEPQSSESLSSRFVVIN